MRNRIGVDLGGRGGGEELGEAESGKTIIRIYEKNLLPVKGKI